MLYDYGQVTPQTVTAEAEAALRRADELVDRAVSPPSLTFDDTLALVELAAGEIAIGYGRSAFMAHVHPDAAVRDAGQAAEEQLHKWGVSITFREDLYRVIRSFSQTDEAAALEGERRRLLEHWLRDFRRAGHELAREQRSELEALRRRVVELEVAFRRNVAEHRDWIEVTREELDGLPETYIQGLKPGAAPGTYRVSLDYPEYNPFIEQARSRPHREALFRKEWNEAAKLNRPLLAEALDVRRRIAALLGYPTWAHYAMEVQMAGNPERVRAFYDDLRPPLEAAARREAEALRGLHAAAGHDDELQPWDWRFYDTQQAREDHGVDQNEVSAYLPLDQVLDGMFALTGDVFGLEYCPVPEARAWHPSVQLFEVRDRESGETLAHFYTDLFPREGKYGHAAAFPLVVGHEGADGTYVRPVSAIVANFTRPSGDRPSLLTHGPHGEIETLFHEFGHILHMSLTRARFTRFSAAETERDFVEAPSQIMEHWVWEPSILQRFAKHFRTGQPIPRELVERMVGARFLNVGTRAVRQVFFGTLDLALHATPEPPDLDAAIREAWAITGLPYPEGTFMLAGFGHLMGGYDAGYYGYLWAEVIGDDMWSRFAAEGITSPDVGRQYRRAVLEPNGSRSGDELVEAFLGRPVSSRSFLRLRGMADSPGSPAPGG
ncbi:MAG TPA: M3 family metallopeptidase [candidate division Zixibacteria bacterium]|nr:M3 family metallopeptidase [candidate division Zixibacteria bacterium]